MARALWSLSASETRSVPGRERRVAKVRDVRLLALSPRRLRRLVGVGARLHDVGDAAAEELTDAPECPVAALVLDGVVQQRGDRLVLVAAVLEDERRDAHEVRDIRDLRALSTLAGVQFARERERTVEARAERRCVVERSRGVAYPPDVPGDAAKLAGSHGRSLGDRGAIELGEVCEVVEPLARRAEGVDEQHRVRGAEPPRPRSPPTPPGAAAGSGSLQGTRRRLARVRRLDTRGARSGLSRRCAIRPPCPRRTVPRPCPPPAIVTSSPSGGQGQRDRSARRGSAREHRLVLGQRQQQLRSARAARIGGQASATGRGQRPRAPSDRRATSPTPRASSAGAVSRAATANRGSRSSAGRSVASTRHVVGNAPL